MCTERVAIVTAGNGRHSVDVSVYNVLETSPQNVFLMSEEIFDTVSESPPSWVRVRERKIERGAKELTTAAP